MTSRRRRSVSDGPRRLRCSCATPPVQRATGRVSAVGGRATEFTQCLRSRSHPKPDFRKLCIASIRWSARNVIDPLRTQCRCSTLMWQRDRTPTHQCCASQQLPLAPTLSRMSASPPTPSLFSFSLRANKRSDSVGSNVAEADYVREATSNGRPAAFHSGNPSFKRRALKPWFLRKATVSNDSTQ